MFYIKLIPTHNSNPTIPFYKDTFRHDKLKDIIYFICTNFIFTTILNKVDASGSTVSFIVLDEFNRLLEKGMNGWSETSLIPELLLLGYELYFLLFPMLFSWKLPSTFSTTFLAEKYRKRRLGDNYDMTPIDAIREYALRERSDQ